MIFTIRCRATLARSEAVSRKRSFVGRYGLVTPIDLIRPLVSVLQGPAVVRNWWSVTYDPRAYRIRGLRYVPSTAHLLGYARVPTLEQNPDLQVDELTAAGYRKVWTDHVSGALDRRPQLEEVLGQLRPGDTVVVWRLDRLGRSLRQLIDTVTGLEGRGVGCGSRTSAC